MEHLTKLTLFLEPQSEEKISAVRIASLGPYLQGLLMESIDSSYAQYLHSLPFNPYSQYCSVQRDGCIAWKINALNDEAADYIVGPLSKLEALELRSAGESFVVESKAQESFDIKKLTDVLKEGNANRHRVRFLTPTAFKSKGAYVMIPSIRLIVQNLLMHYSQIYAGSNEIDEDTVEYIERCTNISSYKLQSQYFNHAANDRQKIPAFIGGLTISVRGPQSICGLIDMLLQFGEFSGVGIKTAMGMGGLVKLPCEKPEIKEGGCNEG